MSDDFKLNLSIGGNVGAAICRPPQENKRLLENFIAWEKKAFRTVVEYYWALRFWGEQIFIHHVKYFEKYLTEIKNIVFVESLVDMMIENMHDFKKQVEFYRDFGKAVADIERKLNA